MSTESHTGATPVPAAPYGAAAAPSRWWMRLLDVLEPTDNPSRTVYGTMAVGLLLAAESAAPKSYAQMLLVMLAAIVGYWLAHGYAAWLGARLESGTSHGSRWSLRPIGHAMAHEWAVVEGAVLPFAVMLLAWPLGVSVASAVSAATWTAAGSLLFWEITIGIRRRLTPVQLLGNLTVSALLGGVLVAIKLFGH